MMPQWWVGLKPPSRHSITVCIWLITHSLKSPRANLFHDGRPAWMRTLLTTSREWLAIIPEVSDHLFASENDLTQTNTSYFKY